MSTEVRPDRSPAIEIERRYLVAIEDRSWETPESDRRLLRQGYVRTEEPAIRVRLGEARGPVLTCKSGRGLKRHEAEVVVPEEMAAALLEAAGERVVEKIRWTLGPWMLDVFVGDLEGLTLLEVELEREDDPIPAAPPGIRVLRDVTNDKRFVNSHLASLNRRKRAKLMRKAYKEVKGWSGLGG